MFIMKFLTTNHTVYKSKLAVVQYFADLIFLVFICVQPYIFILHGYFLKEGSFIELWKWLIRNDVLKVDLCKARKWCTGVFVLWKDATFFDEFFYFPDSKYLFIRIFSFESYHRMIDFSYLLLSFNRSKLYTKWRWI